MKPLSHPALRGGMLLLLISAAPASAALPAWLPLNVNPDHIAHSDTLTWSLLGVLGITLGMVTACGFGIYRQFRRSTPEQELLEEIKREARLPGPISAPLPKQPPANAAWERPADWWKNPPVD